MDSLCSCNRAANTSPSPEATVIQSTGTGFSGLPNNIFSDRFSATGLDTLDAQAFMLIQTDVAPQMGDDIDVDDDGLRDRTAYPGSMEHTRLGLHALFHCGRRPMEPSCSQTTISIDDTIITEPGVEIVRTDSDGYVARFGDSIGSTSADWFVRV